MRIKYLWYKVIKKIQGTGLVNSSVHKTSKIEPGTHFVNSTMDAYSFCGYDCEIINADIKKYCSIASCVKLGGAKHPIEWVGTSPVFYVGRDSVSKKYSEYDREKTKRIKVGNDVWIGIGAIIKSGVTIGDGAVIGAGAVVTKDVRPYEIVAGNPAKHIRFRFDEEIINELLELRWWDFPEDKISVLAEFVREPKRFIVESKKYN